MLFYALPLAAGLAIVHGLLPPHPGPVAAAGLLHADMGLIILFGLICAIPAWFLGGYLYSRWIAARIFVPIPDYAEESFHDEYAEQGARPLGEAHPEPSPTPTGSSLATATVTDTETKTEAVAPAAEAARTPAQPVGMILLAVGAGGVFGSILVASGIGKILSSSLTSTGLPLIVLAFVISLTLRIAQGSATVAIVATPASSPPWSRRRTLPQCTSR
jgi:gluconate:H+ symporter, GntP family